MKHTATLRIQSADPQSLKGALCPDNVCGEELRVESKKKPDYVETKVSCNRLNTLLASLDDIIRCHCVAESVIRDG